ncbi:MAG TPA: hypothetical protein VGG75_38595 [Trebonia sp.]|jgi:hypothetical protein
MARTPGRYGRRSPKRARALRLKNYLTDDAYKLEPLVPAAEDYLTRLDGSWQMLGNDQAGDCVAVTWANMRYLVTTWLTAQGTYPGQSQVWTFYETQNPGFSPAGGTASGPGSPDDNGMDIQTGLEDLVANGGPDGVKALCFAAVDYKNPAEVKAAIAVFGSVWTGINVLDINQTEFSDGQPWDWSPTSPVDGGHSVMIAGYGAAGAGPLGGDERFITWAQETSFTDAFWENAVEECWVVIWPEHLMSKNFLIGMNIAQLAADYQEITGNAFPAVITQPKPVPAPVPAPPAVSPASENPVAELVEGVEKLLAWLKSLV